jgi:lipid-binding SYLF domain-containing protein
LQGGFEMNDMLRQARTSFENLIKMEDAATTEILKEAKAVIFLSTVKSGLGISGVMGSGVMVTRSNDNDKEWSGPIAIGLTGISIGLNAGYEKADNIIIVRDEETLKQLSLQRQIQLSGDIAYAMGNTGHGSSYPLTTQKHENTPIVVYSIAKGAYISLSLEGEFLKIKNDVNEEYYKQKVNVDDILSNKVKVPENNEYNNLVKLLNSYTSNIKNKQNKSKK